ncbi:MAG: 16S rRNA (guanine(966)-N(2))-methyltransferase RsmD [Bacilli bacterium]|nr:16S rRNA (guanine(966)-N(2))-methyltransferase RsmD [Bacilli bacterium]
MKVISGKYKGRKLLGYNIDGTRPTMDRVKESLFASIQDYVKDSIILDLFSGSGSLGIESLSMGSKYAYLNDKSSEAYNIIKKNIESINIKDYKLSKLDYKRALKEYYDNNIKFDIIFLDPPYKSEYIKNSIDLITKYKLLNKEGIIVIESSSIDKISYNKDYIVVKEKKYKDKLVVILKYIC